jgi:hypothetical protein
MANWGHAIASSSERISSSSALSSCLRSDLRCMNTRPEIQAGNERADAKCRAYDTVTDRIWDNINKGVSFYLKLLRHSFGLILCSGNGRTSDRSTLSLAMETTTNRI